MIHLTTSASAQTFKIIPRSYASSVSMILRDDSTNNSTTYSISTTTDKNYLVVSKALSPVLVEGRFYDLTLKEGSNVIYKDKVFCTDQTISSYSCNIFCNFNFFIFFPAKYVTINLKFFYHIF